MDAPVVKAMLVCDNIIIEAVTNKESLIGIFEQINTPNFPVIHYLLGVYVKFTNAQGMYRFRLELRELETDKIIGFGETPEIECRDKLASIELPFKLGGLKFEHPGRYEFRLLANNAPCEGGTKTFEVIKI
jgi:uncharacterized protein YegP (UPF0339 family)